MKCDEKRAARLLGISVAILASFLLLPSGAADIYHYVDSEGNHHYTTYRMSGMRLVDVVRSESNVRRASSESSGRSRRRSTPVRRHDDDAFDEIVGEVSQRYDIPVALIKAVIKAESAFNPRAVSRAGAQGLMQLMPGTAQSLGVEDSFDPGQNIDGGTHYLRILVDRYGGDLNLVLAAYNAGPGAVEQADGIPYEDTRRYIRTVFRYYQEYLQAEP
jgi:soluble lytic murein transglycosylase-like protein